MALGRRGFSCVSKTYDSDQIEVRTQSENNRPQRFIRRLSFLFIATVFRQVSMNRFEETIHTARRSEGELSTERIGELWMGCQPP